MSYIEFENVVKTYGEGQGAVNALDGINFNVEKGEFCVLLGESGAGKTTLLNMLGGMDTITGGKIMFNGRDISSLSKKELVEYRRHDVGFVFQFYNLIPNLTALENVEIAAQLCKNPIDAKTAIEMVDLEDRGNNFPAQLSGGEQQRVAIARALINRPSVVLADEPTGNLDTHNRDEIQRLLFEVREKFGQTIVMVTHDERLAEMADRKIVMSDGQIR